MASIQLNRILSLALVAAGCILVAIATIEHAERWLVESAEYSKPWHIWLFLIYFITAGIAAPKPTQWWSWTFLIVPYVIATVYPEYFLGQSLNEGVSDTAIYLLFSAIGLEHALRLFRIQNSSSVSHAKATARSSD